jgi:hypothetical protein
VNPGVDLGGRRIIKKINMRCISIVRSLYFIIFIIIIIIIIIIIQVRVVPVPSSQLSLSALPSEELRDAFFLLKRCFTRKSNL